jgi:hypothetical protein
MRIDLVCYLVVRSTVQVYYVLATTVVVLHIRRVSKYVGVEELNVFGPFRLLSRLGTLCDLEEMPEVHGQHLATKVSVQTT